MLKNIIDIKNKPSNLLVCETKLCDVDSFIKKYVKSILGEQNKEYHKKIDNGTYFDLMWINANESALKKEQVQEIIGKFSSSSVERSGYKFYVIKNIENCTKQAINSLLKFLEEPFDNTYAIFTTKNINNVLPTIKSRMNTYYLTEDKADLHDLYIKYGISEDMQKVIEHIFLDGSEAISMIKNKKFIKLYNFALNLIENKNNMKVVKESLLSFKKYDYSEIRMIIKIINTQVKKETLNELEEKINLPLNKTLVFNEIWNTIL